MLCAPVMGALLQWVSHVSAFSGRWRVRHSTADHPRLAQDLAGTVRSLCEFPGLLMAITWLAHRNRSASLGKHIVNTRRINEETPCPIYLFC